MCHRIVPVRMDELQLALDLYRTSGHAQIPMDAPAPRDAYPGASIPVIVSPASGILEARSFVWGFAGFRPDRQKLVFNTRIETAEEQLHRGEGMWVEPLTHGRCLVPVRAFYESWTEPGSPAGPGGKAAVRFGLEGFHVFLLAGVCARDRVSIVTTRPNQAVAPIHNRMPMVLGPGESSAWLGIGYYRLKDRSAIRLTSQLA